MRVRILLFVGLFLPVLNQAQINLSNTLNKPKHQVVCSAYSKDSKYIATGGLDSKIIIWEATTGNICKELLGLKDFPISLAFSYDGLYLISGGKDSKVTIWDLQTGKSQSLKGHSNDVTSVDISANNQIASASKDKTIRLWNLSGALIREIKGHTKEVNAVQFNYNGTKLVSGGADGKVIEWNVENGSLNKSLDAHDGWVRSVAYNYNGTLIASGGDDGKIQIWNSSDGKLKNSIIAHSKWVQSLSFSPDGKYIVSGGHDNYLVLINSETGSIVFHSPKQNYFVLSTAFNPNGKNFVSSTLFSDKLNVWDATSLQIKGLAIDKDAVFAKPSISWKTENNQICHLLNFKINASIKSESELSSVDIYINDKLFSYDRNVSKELIGGIANFEKTIYLNAGRNSIKLIAYNSGGETSSEELVVTYEQPVEVVVPKTKAVITWNTSTNFATDTAIAGLNASIKSESAISAIELYINDKKSLSEKNVSEDILVDYRRFVNLNEGLNTIKLVATNEAGQSTSDVLQITYQKPKKKATILWLTQQKTISKDCSSKINALIESETAISNLDVFVNDKKITYEKTPKSNSNNLDFEKVVDLIEGVNAIKLVATNEAGQSTSDMLQIIYQKPKIKANISWLTPSTLTVNEASTKVKAIVKSETQVVGLELYVNDQTISFEKDLAGRANYNINLEKTIELSEGLNTIKLVAINDAGQSLSEALQITYNKPIIPKTKAFISWVTPINLIVKEASAAIKAQIKSETQVSGVDVYLNDKKIISEKAVNGASQNYNLDFNKTINLTEGVNSIKIIATNEAGESVSDLLQITYRKPKPKATIAWLIPNNQTVNEPVASIKAQVKSETQVSSIEIYLNNKKISTENSGNGASQNFNVDLTKMVELAEGLNQLKLVAINEAGQSTSEILQVTYQKPKVKASVSWLTAAKLTTKEASVKIKALIKSETLVNKVDVYINGTKSFTEKNLSGSLPSSTINFEKLVGLVEGLNVVKLIVTNEAGDCTSDILAITYEKPPVVAEETEVSTVKPFPSDVELIQNLPKSRQNPYRYAVIIGNEDYNSYQTDLQSESNVKFAANDAKAFKAYATTILGVPEENVMMLINARAIEMDNTINKLNPIIKALNGKAEIIFYYAGHGFPDEQTKEAYLIPVDVSGTNLKFAIKLKDLYASLTEFPSTRITLFIDACFSGGAREQGLLSARGVKVKPKADVLKGNLVVFTASSGSESALPYKEKQHGMFTYFLLTKLKESEGKISYKELSDYIIEQVGVKSVLINNKPQTPQTNVSIDAADVWQPWRIR